MLGKKMFAKKTHSFYYKKNELNNNNNKKTLILMETKQKKDNLTYQAPPSFKSFDLMKINQKSSNRVKKE